MGQRLFLTYCAQCHGSDAQGAKGFPNLTDGDWLWGGTPDKIKETITGGRNGMMPPRAPSRTWMATRSRTWSLCAFPVGSGGRFDPRPARQGTLCSRHARPVTVPMARAIADAGYPNLTDKVWLYGSSEDTMIETVTKGRTNHMPAFGEFLGEAKVHLLTAYVWSSAAA